MKQLIVFLALILSAPWAMAVSYTLELSEKELQKRVSAMMPLAQNTFFGSIVLSEPDIDLIADSDEIGVFSHIEIIVQGGLKGTGRARITGSLSYQPETSQFFFKNPRIVSLEVDGIPEDYLPQVKNIAQLVASNMLASYPVYTLEKDNVRHSFARAVLQSVSVKNEMLLIELNAL